MLGEGALLYLVLYGLMILFFSYFWVATQFNELQISDDLKKLTAATFRASGLARRRANFSTTP